ncbi:transporter [Defluviicoccus vanus]|uniref:Transporter n=1 Tax=Defluviicoccus vanus TaxID=111831 RepID=A0A7H1N114_9PROT|nr:transporter [Defluviicoccus vanus]QNT69400.1 transporter [Defluviicoccus vanus]
MSNNRLSIVATAFAVGLGALAGLPPTAAALDVDPGDYAAAAPGTNLALGYALFGWNNSFKTKTGDRISNSSLNTQIGILRLVHYTDLLGITADPQIFITFGALNNGKLGGENLDSSFGLGDTIIASTFWFINQPDEKRWLGFTPFFFFPTGKYQDGKPLNVGENRFKQVLQVGFVQGFAEKWTTDLIADTTFYEDNDDYGERGKQTLSQDNSYQLQAWLRYAITPNWQVGGGYSGTYGGVTEVNGDSNGGATRVQQLRLITQYFPEPSLQLQAGVTTDVWAQGQFKEVFGLRFRIMKVF